MSDTAAQQRAAPGSQPDPAGREGGPPSQGFNPFSDPRAAAAGPCWPSSAASAAEPQQSAVGPASGVQAPAAIPSEEALGRPLLPRERALRRLAAMRRERGLPTAEQALARCQVRFCCDHCKSSSPPCSRVLHAVSAACVWIEAAWLLPQGVLCVATPAGCSMCACEDSHLAAGT